MEMLLANELKLKMTFGRKTPHSMLHATFVESALHSDAHTFYFIKSKFDLYWCALINLDPIIYATLKAPGVS